MKTILQEVVQWTIENAFNVTAQDGSTYVAVDHEEMRKMFDEWIERDKQQLIDFHVSTMRVGLINEGGEAWSDGYKPLIEAAAKEFYAKLFNEIIE